MCTHKRSPASQRRLEAVNLHLLQRADLVVNEEVANLRALVTLELDDLAVALVVRDRTVALEVLLERPQDLLQIEIVLKPLHRRDALSPVPLLDADVYLRPGVLAILRERIWLTWAAEEEGA